MDRVSRRWWLAAGLVIGLAGMLIRFWLFQQPVNSDDVQYFADAARSQSLSELGDNASPNSMRLAVLIIPALYSKVFSSFIAFYATVYTFALLTFASLYLFAWVLSGPRAAAIASAIWATANVSISIDTRLTPDNLGTSFALLGLTLIAWVGLRGSPPQPAGAPVRPPLRQRTVMLAAGAGGLLLWLAFCARESFFVFGGVGVAFGLLSQRRWLVTASVLGGLAIGFVIELLVMDVVLGDAWIRWKLAFAYRANVAEAGAGAPAGGDGGGAGGDGFSGYGVADLFVRYPLLVIKASRGEAVLHFVGLAGFLMWAASWRQPRRLAKAACGLVAFGFLAFAIVKLDPVVPLMREKLRYYATAAPLFYLACAELIELAIFRPIRHPRLARVERWLNHRHRTPVVAGLAVLALLWNLSVTSESKEFARSGNDGHWVAAQRMRANAATHDRRRTLYTDGRTARVTGILMDRGDGWGREDLATLVGVDGLLHGEGYVLLDWKRLNANVRSGFAAAWLAHASYRVIERNLLVIRHSRGNSVLDVFYAGPEPVQRAIVPVGEPYRDSWHRMCPSTRAWHPVTSAEVCPDGEREVHVYTGREEPWRARPGAHLDGDQFIQVRIDAHAASSTPLRGWLYWWPSHGDRPIRQPMGSIEIGPEPHPYAMWTYLPQEAESYRVVLRGSPEITVDDVQLYLLSRDAGDDVEAEGAPWPDRPIPDAQQAAISRAIAAHARAHRLPLVIYADPMTMRAGQITPPSDQRWVWKPLPDGADLTSLTESAYVIIDPARLGARAQQRSHGIANSALVVRSGRREEVVDVFHIDGASLERGRETLALDFPAGWTRLLMTPRTMEALPAGTDAAFTSADPKEEIIYSGRDFVWRAPPDGPLAGDRFVEVVGEVSTTGTGELQAFFYYWVKGQKKPIKQWMGSLPIGPERLRFSLWTYLPKDALSYRIALRAGAGTIVSGVEAFAHGRHALDRVSAIGDAW